MHVLNSVEIENVSGGEESAQYRSGHVLGTAVRFVFLLSPLGLAYQLLKED